ncbi:MAG: YwmB family TATA-box binding protein [Thermoanaerobacteraceae bacterium]|nr:YwmB family TATA-box binding protein [Thermoanaerobacteraceae bacterium]
MRKFFIPALLLLVITVFIYPGVGDTQTSMKPAMESMQQSGAAFDGAEINGFSMINKKFMDYEEMKDTAAGLAEYIGSNPNQFKITGQDGKDYRQITLEDQNDRNPFVISLQSYNLPSGEESYLIVNYYNNDNSEDLDSIYTKVEDCFKELNVKKPQISVILTGHFDKKLAEKDMEEIMGSIMSYLDASYQKNELYDNMLTMTGYSEKLSEYIQLGSEKINVDLAMRYSDTDGKTYLWLGTPVITTDY